MSNNSKEVIKMRLVKCPICGRIKDTKGKKYFWCCLQMAFDIEKCIAKELEEKKWRRTKDTDILFRIVD